MTPTQNRITGIAVYTLLGSALTYGIMSLDQNDPILSYPPSQAEAPKEMPSPAKLNSSLKPDPLPADDTFADAIGFNSVHIPDYPKIPLVKPTKVINKILGREPKNDTEWLATNIMMEAANQSVKGKYMVASVTVNRSKMFGNKGIEGTIKNAKGHKGLVYKDKCHYSWYCDGSGTKTIGKDKETTKAWKDSIEAAKKAIEASKLPDYDHYLTLEVEKKTGWVKFMDPKTRTVVGDHVFYRQDMAKVNANWIKQKGGQKNES